LRTIHQTKAVLPPPRTEGSDPFIKFISGAFCDFAGAVANTLFDLVQGWIQRRVKVESVEPTQEWTYSALMMITGEEGAGALNKGFIPKVLRLAPGGRVLLLVVELTLGVS
jgi:solute carrier family 25 (mitochondrial 2-oxodicarboxylate transporter), member 21